MPCDPRVLLWVAPAVAWAAVASGIAGRIIDVEEYRAELEARLGPERQVMRGLISRAQQDPPSIVFPEGDDPRVLRASRILTDERIARPILLLDLEVIAAEPGRTHVSGIYMMIFRQQTFFFADTTVNIEPDAEPLAEIATATAKFVRRLGIEPRVAMLSFSNFGSVKPPAAAKVQQAVALLHERDPDLKA